MVVDLFVPCYIDQLYPQTAFNAIKVLKKCGVEVNYNSQQTCCGKIAFESGFRTEAEELGEKFLNEFSGENPIVGLSVSCVAYIQKRYKNLFYVFNAYCNQAWLSVAGTGCEQGSVLQLVRKSDGRQL